jgi:hypothetical protein
MSAAIADRSAHANPGSRSARRSFRHTFSRDQIKMHFIKTANHFKEICGSLTEIAAARQRQNGLSSGQMTAAK